MSHGQFPNTNSDWQFQVSPGAAWNLRTQARRGGMGRQQPMSITHRDLDPEVTRERLHGMTREGEEIMPRYPTNNDHPANDRDINNDIIVVAENDSGNRLIPRETHRTIDELPANWFTNSLPNNMTANQKQYIAREHRSMLGNLSQLENDLKQLFESCEVAGWNLPPLEGNSDILQQYFEEHNIDMRARENLQDFILRMQKEAIRSAQNKADMASLSAFLLKQAQLSDADAELLDRIVDLSRFRFKFALGIIKVRKSFLKESLLLGLQRLHELNEPDFLDRSKISMEELYDLKSNIMKQQRIILRAIEMEMYSLESYEEKNSAIVQQMGKAINDYYANPNNASLPNPMQYYYQYFKNHSPWTKRGLDLALYEMNVSSDEWNIMHSQVRSHLPQMMSMVSKEGETFSKVRTSRNVFPLADLPHEILAMVLEAKSQKTNIVPLLAVSRSWAEVIAKLIYYRPHINKQHQLNSFLLTMSKPKEETLFDYRSLIKRLNFSFVGDYMTDAKLELFVGCPNLERLTLVFCKYITTKSVAKVLKGCQYLQSVDITGINHIGDDLFEVLASDCERVQGLYVPHSDAVSSHAISTFITHAPMLKRVKITFNETISNSLITQLVRTCPLLVEVDLTSTPNIDNHSLFTLFTALPQLRELRVTQNTNINDTFMLNVSQEVSTLNALRLVDFSGCENITDKTIDKLVTLAPKLRNLFLGKCSRITDASLKSLARLGKNIQTMHFGHCFNISDEGVKALVSSCPKIQYIDFACCTNLTNRTLYELAELPKLKRIGMVKCSQITDEGLLTMISLRGRNDTLERVHLSYCTSLTIYPIYELLMACPKLSHLSLTAVPSFLRPDITQFCRAPPNEFTVNQRQIFCVFSGKGVHKLRHHLMGIHEPTEGPNTKAIEILTRFLRQRHALRGEQIEADDLTRLCQHADIDSAALFAASAVFNFANEPFNQIEFSHLDHVFSELSVTKEETDLADAFFLENPTQLDVDNSFFESPLEPRFSDSYVVVAPPASVDINNELADVIRKHRKLLDRISDFEVNVASLCRIQFQYCGTLIAEMSSIYMMFVDLNRYISEIHQRVLSTDINNDRIGYIYWKELWSLRFEKLVWKFKVTALVLRIYVKESLTVLTRQRELVLQRARETLNREGQEAQDIDGDIDMGVNMLLPLENDNVGTTLNPGNGDQVNLRLFLPPENDQGRNTEDDQIIDE